MIANHKQAKGFRRYLAKLSEKCVYISCIETRKDVWFEGERKTVVNFIVDLKSDENVYYKQGTIEVLMTELKLFERLLNKETVE